jgi:Putative bacterial sensory transduction regulator
VSERPDPVAAVIDGHLQAEAGAGRITVIGRSARAWDVLVPSYFKETVPVSLVLGDRFLRAEAFFLRSPEDRAADAFRLLLRRNLDTPWWRFAVSDSGDVTMVSDVPRPALDADVLDQLLGGVVRLTDETYRPYFRLAYEQALTDQVARGGPGLDQPPPWAGSWDQPAPPPERHGP